MDSPEANVEWVIPTENIMTFHTGCFHNQKHARMPCYAINTCCLFSSLDIQTYKNREIKFVQEVYLLMSRLSSLARPYVPKSQSPITVCLIEPFREEDI